MSGEYLGLAMHTKADISAQERLALIVLGDNCGDGGELRGVPLDFIAEITKTDILGARDIIRALEAKALLETTDFGLRLLLD